MSDPILKQRVARQFSRAAEQYDQAAEVQLDIANHALAMLEAVYADLLDIGCGTGRITRKLTEYANRVWAVDLAEGMCQFARQHTTRPVNWLVGDAEALPLADESMDGVFSSMALQWCEPVSTALQQVYRVLKPGSRGVLALLNEGALTELNQCWLKVDLQRHVNLYDSHNTLVQQALDVGFDVEAEEKNYVTYHQDLRQLLGSIKAIGANVVTENANHAPMSKTMLQQLMAEYETLRKANGKLPLSYQVTFLRLTK